MAARCGSRVDESNCRHICPNLRSKEMLKHALVTKSLIMLLLGAGIASAQPTSKPIQHDAEHYMLLKQHVERWVQEDEAIAAKLK
mgnify:FL=1